MSEEPSEELMAMLTSGEWYFDPGHATVTGYIFAAGDEEGTEPRIVRWIPDNYHLFSMLRVRPATQPDVPDTPDEPDTPNITDTPDTPGQPAPQSILQQFIAFIQRILNFIRDLFNR